MEVGCAAQNMVKKAEGKALATDTKETLQI